MTFQLRWSFGTPWRPLLTFGWNTLQSDRFGVLGSGTQPSALVAGSETFLLGGNDDAASFAAAKIQMGVMR
jgi:hypothetical protein